MIRTPILRARVCSDHQHRISLLVRSSLRFLHSTQYRLAHGQNESYAPQVAEQARGDGGQAVRVKRVFAKEGPTGKFDDYQPKRHAISLRTQDVEQFKAASRRQNAIANKEKLEGLSNKEIIVLRRNNVRYTEAPDSYYLSPIKAESVNAVDILARVDAERGLVSPSQVHDNIDGLRPDLTHGPVSWETFQKIEKLLCEGFTMPQLLSYIRKMGRERVAPRRADLDMIDGGAPVNISRWVPGVSPSIDSFDSSSTRGYIASQSFTKKQKLVVQLMRECWDLEVIDLVQDPGEIEIYMKQVVLELLLKGQYPALKNISDSYLRTSGSQMEVSRSRWCVRVLANKEHAHAVAEAIAALALDYGRIKVPSNLSSWFASKDPLTDEQAEELGRLTGTVVAKLKKDSINVYGKIKAARVGQSSPAEVANRLLMSSARFAEMRATQTALLHTNGQLVAVRQHNTAGLPWKQRTKQWTRWVCETSKDDLTADEAVGSESAREHLAVGVSSVRVEPSMGSESADNESDTSSAGPTEENHPTTSVTSAEIEPTTVPYRSHDRRGSVPTSPTASFESMSRVVHESKKPSQPENSVWEAKSQVSTSVILGHILHQATGDSFIEKLLDNQEAERSEFLATAQNISYIFQGDAEGNTQEGPADARIHVANVRMRFIPDPCMAKPVGIRASKLYPEIHMGFALSQFDRGLVLKDIVAITNAFATDVMIPDRAHDLRFDQVVLTKMKKETHQLPAIQDFLAKSQLTLSRGPLGTPPKITLPIARHLCNSPEDQNLKGDDVDIAYVFAGLEFRNKFSTNFQGWPLTCVNVDKGKAQGSSIEVALRPFRFQVEDLPLEEHQKMQQDHIRELIESAFNLVDVLENPEAEEVIERTVAPSVTQHWSSASGRYLPQNYEFRLFSEPIDFRVRPEALRQKEIERVNIAKKASRVSS